MLDQIETHHFATLEHGRRVANQVLLSCRPSHRFAVIDLLSIIDDIAGSIPNEPHHLVRR